MWIGCIRILWLTVTVYKLQYMCHPRIIQCSPLQQFNTQWCRNFRKFIHKHNSPKSPHSRFFSCTAEFDYCSLSVYVYVIALTSCMFCQQQWTVLITITYVHINHKITIILWVNRKCRISYNNFRFFKFILT